MTKSEIEREVKASLENCYMLGGSRGTPSGDTAYIDRLTQSIMNHIDNLEPTVPTDSKHPRGYLPKIEYWEGKLADALSENNHVDILKCNDKLEYFRKKQAQL